jgi:hypothetical protein
MLREAAMDKNLLSPARGRVLGRVLESRERGFLLRTGQGFEELSGQTREMNFLRHFAWFGILRK